MNFRNVPETTFDNTRLTPFFAEWLGQTTQTMTDWRMIPKAVAQILQRKIDSFTDKVYVKLGYCIFTLQKMVPPTNVNKFFLFKFYQNGEIK